VLSPLAAEPPESAVDPSPITFTRAGVAPRQADPPPSTPSAVNPSWRSQEILPGARTIQGATDNSKNRTADERSGVLFGE
jgi:hypothetical protein